MTRNHADITSFDPSNPNLISNDKESLRLIRQGKVALAVGAGILAAVTIHNVASSDEVDTPKPLYEGIYNDGDSANTDKLKPESKTVEYAVKNGDSPSSVIANVYGADDGRTIMNNEFYKEEVAAVEGAMNDGMLQPDQVLELPFDITAPKDVE